MGLALFYTACSVGLSLNLHVLNYLGGVVPWYIASASNPAGRFPDERTMKGSETESYIGTHSCEGSSCKSTGTTLCDGSGALVLGRYI
jgi:hypothetical protein